MDLRWNVLIPFLKNNSYYLVSSINDSDYFSEIRAYDNVSPYTNVYIILQSSFFPT